MMVPLRRPEGGATARSSQVDLSQNLPPLDWFYWDAGEEDFIKKLSQITLNIN